MTGAGRLQIIARLLEVRLLKDAHVGICPGEKPVARLADQILSLDHASLELRRSFDAPEAVATQPLLDPGVENVDHQTPSTPLNGQTQGRFQELINRFLPAIRVVA